MKEANPFDVLEDVVRRKDLEEKAAKVIGDTRARLILGNKLQAPPTASVFFGTLAMRLKYQPDWDIETAQTDGKELRYNPEFLVRQSKDQAAGLLVHEIMHPALSHHTRRGLRDPKKWNLACDLSVNPTIRESGFQLPAGGVFPGEGEYQHLAAGLAAEEYYALLESPGDEEPNQDGEEGKGGGKGPPDPGGCGSVTEPSGGDTSTQKASEAEWKVALAQAEACARQRGAMPGGLARLVGEALAPVVNWREVLREFVSRFAKNDFTWSPCNRKLLSQGLYLPGLRSEELGEVICAVDTSGSIGEKELQVFGSELQGILDCFDCSLTILYHDTDIMAVQKWQSSDGPLVLEAKGGGGTSHCCVFDWVKEHAGEEAPCVVCLTDLYTQFPETPPSIPVLWAVVGNERPEAPWGQIVQVTR